MERTNLWLDDKRPAPPGWVVARTAREARMVLERDNVERLSLDYTLRNDDENGESLVQWMSRTGHWPARRPRVHSSNLFGRLRMSLSIAWNWRRRRSGSVHSIQTA